jgi:phenylpropionate dioxygenase-like ring-hydroxylating dioxygenase large terminal subunit
MSTDVTTDHAGQHTPGARFPIELTRRIVARYGAAVASESLDTVESSATESADVFTDPIRFEVERHQLFRCTPQVVGWTGEVRGPHSYVAKDVAGVQVLITRDGDGTLRAFRNACPHRGAQVAAGCGEARRLSCPYHAWTFDLAGKLVGQPESWAFDDCDPAGFDLRALPVADVAGLLVVGLEPDVDPAHALDDIAAELTWCGYADHEIVATQSYTVAANWKLVVDINLEVYHVASLHRESLHPLVANHTVNDTFGRHARHAFPTRAAAELVGRPEHEWPSPAPISVVHTLFPSTVVLETPVSSQMFRIYPGRHVGETVIHLAEASLHPVTSDEERQGRLFGFDYTKRILEMEDFPAAEQSQRGAESGLDRFTFGRLEPMLQHWHAVWRRALDGGAG